MVLADYSPVRFTVEEFDRIIETGIFDARWVELLEGEIIESWPSSYERGFLVSQLTCLFVNLLSERRAAFWLHSGVVLRPDNEVAPDFCLIDRSYGKLQRNPEPDLIFLLIEVCITDYHFDRNRKLPLYARQGLREVWLVNDAEKRIEVYRDPDTEKGEYRTVLMVSGAENIAPLAFPDVAISTNALFERKG